MPNHSPRTCPSYSVFRCRDWTGYVPWVFGIFTVIR